MAALMLIGSIICLIVCFIVKNKSYFESVLLALKLDGPPAKPIFGNTFDLKDMNGLINKLDCSKLRSPVWRIWASFMPIFLVYEPEHLKIILSSSKVSEKGSIYRLMQSVTGKGIINKTGSKWKKNRKLSEQLFQSNFLEAYFDTFAESSRLMLIDLEGQKSVKINDYINILIFKTLHKIVLGVDLRDINESPFNKPDCFFVQRVFKPWLLFDSIFKYSSLSTKENRQISKCHIYVQKILEKKLANNDKIPCFLNWFIQFWNNNEMTKEEVLDETVSFLLAGSDATATQITFCLYFLAKYQNIQEKVFEEIVEVTNNTDSKTLSLKEINNMHYLERCIKETLRLVPTIPVMSRELLTDVTLGEIKLRSGYQVFVTPIVTQRLPHVFPDPLKFDPDRFLPENFKAFHPYGYIPFSKGHRICIGKKFAMMEMKTVIAFLVRNYHLELMNPTQELHFSYKLTLRLKGGLWLNIVPRKKSHLSHLKPF